MKTEQEQLEYINTTCNTNYKSMDEVIWWQLSMYHNLSENFIREFADKLDWRIISISQKLSEDFIREFADKLDWKQISTTQKLSEDFIREFADKLDWRCISLYQKLSEDFIRVFKYDVDWCYISQCQKLSEDFIREFADKVFWYNISQCQVLSENFIREFKNKFTWHDISKCQKLSESFINEFKDWLYPDLIEDNWNYKDKEFLKQQVIDTGLYECHDDYFIAYKGIRSDRYSKFNFKYQYLPGETYESWCDCSSEENSFGLSVWTEEKACNYCKELVVKVKVNYEDVGRVIHNGGKIRCKKITILD